jgi:UDP-glucuronate 4-epimerase
VYIKNAAGPIIYNKGEMTRDWTHVDDIVGGILTILHADTPHGEVYNIGRNNPQNILEVYKLVHAWFYDIPVSEVPLDHIDWQEKHAADTVDTWADTTKLEKLGYKCSHDVKDRIKEFVDWVKKNG